MKKETRIIILLSVLFSLLISSFGLKYWDSDEWDRGRDLRPGSINNPFRDMTWILESSPSLLIGMTEPIANKCDICGREGNPKNLMLQVSSPPLKVCFECIKNLLLLHSKELKKIQNEGR